MNWKKYNSIENSYRDKTYNMIQMHPCVKEEWCVTEKAHGSNLSFAYDSTDFRVAKRTCLIDDGANFFNQSVLREKYQAKIIAIYGELKEKYDFDTLIVYGETIGGLYDHPDVEKNPNITKVQKGIHYTPDCEFYAFDIGLDGDILNYDESVALFKKHGLFYAKILFRGNLDECLKYPNDYQTNIPEWLGLPPIENNITEGNVIKPINHYKFNSGERIILKNKNKIFSEKSKRENKPKEAIELTDECLFVADELRSFITENRLRNVLSHIGEVTDKDFGKIMREYAQDIWKDFEKDNIEQFNLLDEKEQKLVKKVINNDASTMIRNNFVNIIDGEF